MKKEEKLRGIPKEGEVDAVYLWVDSNNSKFIKEKNYYSKKYKLNKYWSPTRDHNEILHSIKSVRKNMSWVRNIFVICPKGHKIFNLDEKKYDVKYINHEILLGSENCPNYNSSTLELFQYKIPKLSEYFIAFNDDFFIVQKVNLDDFFNFNTNKIKYYYEQRLQLGLPFSPTTSKIIQDYFPNEKYYFWMCHMPRMFNKNDLKEIVEKYKKDAEFTRASKFRNKKDIQLVYLYGYYLLAKNRGEFIFLENASSRSSKHLFKLLMDKMKIEGIIETLKQVYLQYFYIRKLVKNKQKSSKKIYSLINIDDDYVKNKEQIKYALNNKIKFICLNDCYNTTDEKLKHDIMKENFEFFYNELDK